MFFAGRVSARDARRLGTAIISHTCARTRQLRLTSYDRLFPNQHTMPKGGFGNLIALPLQKGPREQGFSVFVDADLRPYPDPWAFLASIQPMAAHDIELEPELREAFMAEAEASHRPASQVVRELMREFVERHRQAREYDAFLRAKVDAARAQIASGQVGSSADVEARFAARRAAHRAKTGRADA